MTYSGKMNDFSDLDILNLDQALEYVAGEKELLKELLDAFVKDKKLSYEKLLSLEESDKVEAAKYVHYFKGGGRQLCAQRLNAAGQRLEDFLRGRLESTDEKEVNVEDLNKDFVTAYQEALKAMENALGEF